MDAVSECAHIWMRQVLCHGYRRINTPKPYECIKCHAVIRTMSLIPRPMCRHVWKKVEHALGPNYVKNVCEACHEEIITCTVQSCN